MQDVLGHYHPGQPIRIRWSDRAGQPRTATVTLTTGPAG